MFRVGIEKLMTIILMLLLYIKMRFFFYRIQIDNKRKVQIMKYIPIQCQSAIIKENSGIMM